MTTKMFMLKDLNCPTCAADIERAFKRMKGVAKASVTFATGTLNVEYDETVVDEAAIKKAVEGFGASVVSSM